MVIEQTDRAASRAGPALRNAAAFLAVPALAALLIGAWATFAPPDFAHPSQAAALHPAALAPILLLGALGIYASIRSNMTPDPLRAPAAREALVSALASGLLLGAVTLFLDRATGFSAIVAQRLGIDSIHIDFPASLFVYTAGAIAVECLYR